MESVRKEKNFVCIFKQTIITPPSGTSKSKFSLQLIATREQVQDLIHEFEPDIELQKKDQLSLNGLYSNQHLF
jgi:hypothetical protein